MRWPVIAAAFLGLLLLSLLVPSQEEQIQKQQQKQVRITQMEPYGGCKEAYLYPDSVGYEECQKLGLVP